MYCCSLSVKTITHKKLHGARRSGTHLLCVCFCVCGWQKPKDPQIEPHGWQPHYLGWYRSGFSSIYLWICTNPWTYPTVHMRCVSCSMVYWRYLNCRQQTSSYFCLLFTIFRIVVIYIHNKLQEKSLINCTKHNSHPPWNEERLILACTL